MKKKSTFLSILLFCAACMFGQANFNATPQGFGAATTGGGNVTPETVTTFTDLRTKIMATGAKVILVSGQITIPSGQPISAVVTNKSIIGLSGAKLINENQSNPGAGILYLKPGSSNVIIRNLIFVGPGAYDIDGQDNLTADGCTNLWVDHCEFQDGQDGNFDMKGLTDNVTVSWCKFTYLKPAVCCGSGGSNDHRFSDLVGSSASNAPADGHYSITFQGCYWADGCKERMPRARNAQLHILNCYYNTSVSGSRAIGLGGGINNATCYVENTHFARVGSVFTSYVGTDGGTASVKFTGCLNGATDVGTVATPTYTTTVLPVADVAGYVTDVTCGAGATLQVSTTGAITAGTCTLMGNDEPQQNAVPNLYAIQNDGNLKLYLPFKQTEKASVTIYSLSGQKVLDLKGLDASTGVLDVNIDALQHAAYTCKVQVNGGMRICKFIKN